MQETWTNISGNLSEASSSMSELLAEIESWEGKDADGYRALAEEFSGVLSAASTVASCMSGYMMLMGLWTAVTRALILELICNFVSRGILYLIAAAASSVVTFGGSIAAAITGLVIDAISSFAKIMKHIGGLLKRMAALIKRFDAASDILTKAGKWMDGKGGNLLQNMTSKLDDMRLDAFNKSNPGELFSWTKTSYGDNKSSIFNDFTSHYDDFWGSNKNWFTDNFDSLGRAAKGS